MQLILGTRRYSSWSLRGWLVVRLAGLSPEEHVVPIADGVTEALRPLSPSGLVPVLRQDGLTIWDSLAIAEYCAEIAPALWPLDRNTRAVARSVAAEMHSGFSALRRALPMNLGREPVARALSAEVAADIARVEQVWSDCLARSGGPFLFGPHPTIPDIMYAPVVTRFFTYRVALGATASAYCRTVRGWDLVESWYAEAAREPAAWHLAKYE